MHVAQAYQALTQEAKLLAVRSIVALAEAAGRSASAQYVRQTMNGERVKQCSPDLARIISGYFTGQVGIAVSPEEVMAARPDGMAAPAAV